jgi:hypothetical protein
MLTAVLVVIALLGVGVPAAAADERVVSLSVTASKATARQFLDGKMKLHVHCAAQCDVRAEVDVSSANAKRLGMLTFRDPDPIGTASVTGHAPGDFDLVVVPASEGVHGGLGFPLFRSLPITIVATSGTARATATSSLAWPKPRPQRGGRSDGRYIKSITGPRKVSLRARYASFRVRITRIPARTFVAIIVTAGNHFTPTAPDALPDGVADRGGTFTMSFPIRRTKGRADAAKLVPLAAQLSLGLVTKRTGENAIFRFTLVR